VNSPPRTLTIAILACLGLAPWVSSAARADTTPDTSEAAAKATDATTLQNNASNLITKQFGPFKFTAGPSTTGAFTANLDGKGEKDGALGSIDMVENVDKLWFPASYNIGYAADGTWNSDPKTPNNGTLSLKPGLDTGLFHGIYRLGTPTKDCSLKSPQCGTVNSIFPAYWFGFGGYMDLQYRYGTIQQNASLMKANQSDAGAGMFAVFPIITDGRFLSIDSAPRVSATYYHPVTTTGGMLALPTGITANYLQTEFHIELGVLPKGAFHVGDEEYSFKLDVLYDGSKPMTGANQQWKSLWKLQLYTALVKSGNTSAAITYQSGKQAGFTYDHQVILGILVHFLDPGASK
jgi:hypothetical protein